MIVINGRKFAANHAEVTDSLFEGQPTAQGLYKVKRGRGRLAIELFDLRGNRRALIFPDGAFVTAHDLQKGKRRVGRYLYALDSATSAWLGLSELSDSALSDLGRSLIAAQTQAEAANQARSAIAA